VIPLFVGKRRHHIDTQYLLKACGDFLAESVRTVLAIHTTERPGAILVFLPDKRHVQSVVDQLREWSEMSTASSAATTTSSSSSSTAAAAAAKGKLSIVPLYEGMSDQEQLRAMRPARPGVRKIIVSTSVAESSLTIDDVVYVVDSCYDRMKHFNPATCLDMSVTLPISKASAIQREGRGGRTRPGKCFRLCTLTTYNEILLDSTVPQIERSSLVEIVLQLKALGVRDVLHFPYLSPPPIEYLSHALETLHSLGALNDEGSITRDGLRMADLPCTPSCARMLLEAHARGCLQDALTLAGMLSLYSMFVDCKSSISKQQRDHSHLTFANQRGDHLTMIDVYREYDQSSDPESFATQHCLSSRGLRRAEHVSSDLRRQLAKAPSSRIQKKLTRRERIDTPRGSDEDLLKSVLAGYFAQIARLHGTGKYQNIKGGALVSVSKQSVLSKYPSGRPVHWIVYHEVQRSKYDEEAEIYDVSCVNPQWITEVAPHYFTKRQGAGGSGSGVGGGSLYYADRYAVERSNERSKSSTSSSSSSSSFKKRRY